MGAVRRWRWPVAALAAAAIDGTVVLTQPFADSGEPARAGTAGDGAPTALATVERRTLSSRTTVKGTLGYAGRYGVVNQAQGTVTWLPRAGRVLHAGQVIYRVADKPIVCCTGGCRPTGR